MDVPVALLRSSDHTAPSSAPATRPQPGAAETGHPRACPRAGLRVGPLIGLRGHTADPPSPTGQEPRTAGHKEGPWTQGTKGDVLPGCSPAHSPTPLSSGSPGHSHMGRGHPALRSSESSGWGQVEG